MPPLPHEKVGLARNVVPGAQPLNGLRHPPEGGTCGWYLWAGEELSDAPDFFERLWGRLKEWRAVATRYEKTASAFLGVLHVAAAMDWIKHGLSHTA